VDDRQSTNHPTLILIRGLPGSGKTHLTTALRDAIGRDKVVMLDPDSTDYESKEYLEHVEAQTAEGVDPKLHAYRFLRAKAYEGIAANKIILWNQPFTNLGIFNKMIERLETHAAEHSVRLPILVVEVEVDPALAKQRVLSRKAEGGHGPSDNTFTRFVGDYASFASEGFNTVTVRGEDDVAVSVSTVMKGLERLGQK